MKAASIILILGAIIAGFIFLGRGNSGADQIASIDNVSVVDGQQIIEIRARGGYSPRLTEAKAGLPTVIRFITEGSFDCSLAVRIPSLNISQILPQTGVTDIAIGTPQAGPFLGTCGMGMYRFQINFQR